MCVAIIFLALANNVVDGNVCSKCMNICVLYYTIETNRLGARYSAMRSDDMIIETNR